MKRIVLSLMCLLTGCDTGMTVGEAEDKVRATLRDPTSAEFTQEVRHAPQGDRGAVVCGYVNAKNGFGGMTGPKRFVASAQTLIDEDTSETGREVFEGGWSNLCPQKLHFFHRRNSLGRR